MLVLVLLLYYFRQGHTNLLEASSHQGIDQQLSLFNLPAKILCKVFNIQLLNGIKFLVQLNRNKSRRDEKVCFQGVTNRVIKVTKFVGSKLNLDESNKKIQNRGRGARSGIGRGCGSKSSNQVKASISSSNSLLNDHNEVFLYKEHSAKEKLHNYERASIEKDHLLIFLAYWRIFISMKNWMRSQWRSQLMNAAGVRPEIYGLVLIGVREK